MRWIFKRLKQYGSRHTNDMLAYLEGTGDIPIIPSKKRDFARQILNSAGEVVERSKKFALSVRPSHRITVRVRKG